MTRKDLENTLFQAIQNVKSDGHYYQLYSLKYNVKKTLDTRIQAINHHMTIEQSKHTSDNDFSFDAFYNGMRVFNIQVTKRIIEKSSHNVYGIKSVEITTDFDDLMTRLKTVVDVHNDIKRNANKRIFQSMDFIKSLGFSNFQDFRQALLDNLTYEQIKGL